MISTLPGSGFTGTHLACHYCYLQTRETDIHVKSDVTVAMPIIKQSIAVVLALEVLQGLAQA